MAEILGCGALHKAFKELGIEATRTYKSADKPYYQVWELTKDDIKKLEYATDWNDEWGWFCHSNGEHRGTAYDIINIHGVSTIAWQEDGECDTFDCLTDYFKNCLGVTDAHRFCSYSVYLAKNNGWTLAELWKRLEG